MIEYSFPLKVKEVCKMKKHPKLLNLSVILFAFMTGLFLLFFLYVNHYERIDIYQSRQSRSYEAIET